MANHCVQKRGAYGDAPWYTDKTLGENQVNADATWIWDKDDSTYARCRIVLPGKVLHVVFICICSLICKSGYWCFCITTFYFVIVLSFF